MCRTGLRTTYAQSGLRSMCEVQSADGVEGSGWVLPSDSWQQEDGNASWPVEVWGGEWWHIVRSKMMRDA